MSDELFLFLILCLIYVTDCLLWVSKYSVAFVTWINRQWKDKVTSRIFRTSKGGLLLLNPFPPLGKVFCCHLLPISISPVGICSLNNQILTHREFPEFNFDVSCFNFKEISNVTTDGRKLIVNAAQFCRFWDAQQAERVCALLKTLITTPETSRETIIKQFWNEQFNLEAAKKRYEDALHQMTSLRFLCNILFVYLFIIAPVVVLYRRMTSILIAIAFVMFVIAFQITIEFYILHKRTYPDLKEDRISSLIKMILCPPVSIRACDLITEHLLGNYNSLVVANLLLSDDQFKNFAISTLRNLKYPPFNDFMEERVCEISNWQNHTLLKIATGYLHNASYSSEKLLYPPIPNDPSVRAYCPRCLCQFTQKEGNCPDCLGVKILPFNYTEPFVGENE